MFKELEDALCRPLTVAEKSKLTWLYDYAKDNREVIEKLFSDLFKAGQEDAKAYHEAIQNGTAR